MPLGISRSGVLLALAFVLAVAGAFFFGVRAERQARLLRFANEPIRPWMSVPFIAHVHHVPPDALFAAVGLPVQPHDRRSLRHIARDLHRPVAAVVSDIEKALAASGHPSPPAATHPETLPQTK